MSSITTSEKAVDERQKNFLTEAEIETFLRSARHGRHGVRNFAMMLLAYRHALRVSELMNIRMVDLDLDSGRLFVRRNKGSRLKAFSGVDPISSPRPKYLSVNNRDF